MVKFFCDNFDLVMVGSFRKSQDYTYTIGDLVFVLPLACGKKKISKERLKHYGKHGKIIKGFSTCKVRLQTETEKITVLLEDIVPFESSNVLVNK